METNSICKLNSCGTRFSHSEIARIYGSSSSISLLGYCSAKCYTQAVTSKKETEHPYDLAEKGKKYDNAIKALKSAKRIIKIWYDKAHGDMGQYFWDEYQQKPFMKRINKAIDGK